MGKLKPMNTNILHSRDGTYSVTVNGQIVAAGLTNGAAWREAERLVDSDTADARAPMPFRSQRKPNVS